MLLTSSRIHAGIFEDDDARRALLEQREKFNALQAEISEKFEKNGRLLLDIQSELSLLKDETARLRGQIEVGVNNISQLEIKLKEVNQINQTLDLRLKNLEPKHIILDGKSALVSPNEINDYEATMEFVRIDDKLNASEGLQNFIKKYPSSIYIPMANFWLGNMLYGMKQYKLAVQALHNMLKKNPEHSKSPDALAIIASSQFESGNKTQARKTWAKIISEYPDTKAANLARAALN